MAYPFSEVPDLTTEQAQDWRLARDYAAMTSTGAWKDLWEYIEAMVKAAQDTLSKDQTQRPMVAFGLLKRWQERKDMRDLIEFRVRQFQKVVEDIKEESNEYTGDSGVPGDDPRSND